MHVYNCWSVGKSMHDAVSHTTELPAVHTADSVAARVAGHAAASAVRAGTASGDAQREAESCNAEREPRV
jgi:hypothetical protein